MSSKRQLTVFPEIDSSYIDQFGFIDKEVYSVALAFWPQANRYALSMALDEARARDLMLITVARVSKIKSERNDIDSVRNYLWLVFKRLLVEELKRNRKFEDSHISFDDLNQPGGGPWQHSEIPVTGEDIIERLNKAILIEELLRRMDHETCAIFEKLILGYTFSEIAKSHSQSAPVIRNKFRRRMIRLAEQIREQSPDGATLSFLEHKGW